MAGTSRTGRLVHADELVRHIVDGQTVIEYAANDTLYAFAATTPVGQW